MTSVIVFLVVVTIVVCVILNTYGINVFKKLGGVISKLFKSEKKEKKEKKPKEKKKDKQSSIDDAIPVSKINKAEDKKKSVTKIMKPVEVDKLRADIAEKIDEDSKKAKGVPLGGGKVEKVTKEDFQKNSIVLPPSSNFSDQPFENFSKSKTDDDDFSFMKEFGGDPFGPSPSMPRSSKSSVDDLDLDALLRELEEESKNDMPGISGDYNEDPFVGPKFGDPFEAQMPKKSFNPFEDDAFQEVSSFSELNDDEDDELDFAPPIYQASYAGAGSGGFITQSVGDRYDAVFGSGAGSVKNKIAKF